MDSEHDQAQPAGRPRVHHRVDRRTFLRVAGVSAAGAVAAACGPGGSPSPVASSAPVPTTSAPPSSRLPTGPPNWDDLRGKLTGNLLRPGADGYDTAKRAFNQLFDNKNPVAVVTASTAQDVQASVQAVAGRASIAARSGGHSYAGYSVPDGGLVVDVAGLDKVEVQGSQAVIGAGAKLKDVYAALGRAGRALPAGSCPTVGIAGLTLGGGIGVLSRKYGLTCDRLSSAQVVMADGRLVKASADTEPDLFWGLRGGGGGNFGIVTEFTFDTDPAPDLTVFSLHFPAGSAADVLNAWQQWIAAMPPELWANCVLSGGSPVQCRVGGCYVGGAAGLNTLLTNLTTNAGARPTQRTVKSLDYLGAMNYFSGSSNRQSFVASSRIVTSPVDAAKVVALADGRTGTDLLIDGLGGKVGEPAKDATAFWHRDALASVQIYAPATAKTQQKVTQSVGEVAAGLAAAGAGGGYVNYIDPALADWKTAYYGDNAKRLQDVAKKYDPDNVFRFGQSVRS
ncbi:FAD-binding oxidoreductase [Amycolatopsis sp. FBCC-B4732]|uniref:FAD-dependent oxidoreductase n=1 Tax=Amycolatopsis sp. FBCC-B4732 TaxID=3079339 RepID=UPI001FF5D1DE|nr:FAD-binding oxidoreductase [Amycolatopsis sp. FBCC-B4732]UOX86530.1 FAD-binding oxidoreductase [Amycolatopsis sp. FBCC-B4732]